MKEIIETRRFHLFIVLLCTILFYLGFQTTAFPAKPPMKILHVCSTGSGGLQKLLFGISLELLSTERQKLKFESKFSIMLVCNELISCFLVLVFICVIEGKNLTILKHFQIIFVVTKFILRGLISFKQNGTTLQRQYNSQNGDKGRNSSHNNIHDSTKSHGH